MQTTSAIRLELKLEKVNRAIEGVDSRLNVIDRRAQGDRKWDGQVGRRCLVSYSNR